MVACSVSCLICLHFSHIYQGLGLHNNIEILFLYCGSLTKNIALQFFRTGILVYILCKIDYRKLKIFIIEWKKCHNCSSNFLEYSIVFIYIIHVPSAYDDALDTLTYWAIQMRQLNLKGIYNYCWYIHIFIQVSKGSQLLWYVIFFFNSRKLLHWRSSLHLFVYNKNPIYIYSKSIILYYYQCPTI